jgi:hypothetical protein
LPSAAANPLWRLYLEPALSWLRSLPRRRRQLVCAWPDGAVPLGERVAVFVHFDREGAVSREVAATLAALRAAGFSVVFVSNAGMLKPASRALLGPLCAAILVRRNLGWDFAAVADALAQLGLPRPGTSMLLLVNDSIIGPLGGPAQPNPLASVLARIDFSHADLWGATENQQIHPHLQSFFLAAGPRALAHPAWAAFWRTVRPVASKTWVIRRYEVGLTRSLRRAGLRCRPLFSEAEMLALLPETAEGAQGVQLQRIRRSLAEQRRLNPTLDLWRELLLAGFPFIKRELLRDNPTGVADLADAMAISKGLAAEAPDAASR